MASDDSFARFQARLETGDAGATVIFQRFTGRLIALARSRLAPWLQRKVDPEDVVQSVYGSFFKRGGAGQRPFTTWEELWGLLATITVRKVIKRVEYLHAQRRDARREQSLNREANDRWQGVDPQPTPADVAIFSDLVEQLLNRLTPEDRPIIDLSLQGLAGKEIGERLGRAERTVGRVRQRFMKQLERLLTDDTDPP